MKTLYDGKTKTVLLNEDTGVVNLFFKDSATGENGYFDPGFNTVGGSVEGKGKIGLQISKHFFEIMEKNGTPVSVMLSLEVPDEELVKRLLLRGKESGRADDSNEGVIRDRIDVYKAQTLSLIHI